MGPLEGGELSDKIFDPSGSDACIMQIYALIFINHRTASLIQLVRLEVHCFRSYCSIQSTIVLSVLQ